MKFLRVVKIGLLGGAFLTLPLADQCIVSAQSVDPNLDRAVLAQFSFEPEGLTLKVPASVGADHFQFALATSNSSFFGRPFAQRLARLPPELDSPDDPFLGVYFRSAPRMSLGALTLQFPHSFVECGFLRSFGDQIVRSEGVIGLDILAQHVMEIDFDAGWIRFLRTIPKEPGDRFEITSLQKKPPTCAVTIKAQCCDGPAEDFYVELENSEAISIRSPVFLRLFEKRQIRHLHTESTFGTEKGKRRLVGSADSFAIGRIKAKNLRAAASGDNIIGLGFLSRFVVTFDFPSGFMYMRPGKQFDKVDGHDVSGLYADWAKNMMTVIGCEPGSPADEAGLQEHDVILAIDGQPVNLECQASFRSLIRNEGRTLRIDFRRGGQYQNVELKLEAPPGKILDEIDSETGSAIPGAIPEFKPRNAPPVLPALTETENSQKAT